MEERSFEIHGAFFGDKTFPSLNNYLSEMGRHPKAGNRMKQDCENIAIVAIRTQLGRWQTEQPVVVHYEYFEPNRGQKRDLPNVHAMASKVILDSLVRCKVIHDDNPTYVRNETHEFYYTDGEPFIRITIEEVTDDDVVFSAVVPIDELSAVRAFAEESLKHYRSRHEVD